VSDGPDRCERRRVLRDAVDPGMFLCRSRSPGAPDVASIRAAATPPAVALPVSDRRGHAIPLAAVTALSAKESCASQTSGGQEREAWASGGRTRDDCFDLGATRRRAIALATLQSSAGGHARLLRHASERQPRRRRRSLSSSRRLASDARNQRQAGVPHLGRGRRRPPGVADVCFLRMRSSACRCRLDCGGSRFRPDPSV